MSYVTGEAIRTLREQRGCTQRQLADSLAISDKTVSKWETGRGLPDISLIEPLARALGVSLAELLAGEYRVNRNRSGNLLRGHFYVCPVCGNVIHAMGEGSFSCCGVTLPPLEAETPDEAHTPRVERVENDNYITFGHPMEKDHYLSFLALVTDNRLRLLKLYPEQNAEGRFAVTGNGFLYWYCNRHGLFRARL